MTINGNLVENEWTMEFSTCYFFKLKEQKIQLGGYSETMWYDWECTLTSPHLPDVTDLSETSRGALPPPARATAFKLLLAVMFVSKPSTHLMDKNMDVDI